MRIFILFVVMSIPLHCLAETLHVPGDYSTIQEAIDTAANGDTVLVASGDYFENLTISNKWIVLESAEGPDESTIDGSSAGSVVTIENAPDRVYIIGFQITNGSNKIGAGINITESDLELSSCKLTDNSAWEGYHMHEDGGDGGGIYADTGSNLFCDNCYFTNNRAGDGEDNDYFPGRGGHGGGVYCHTAAFFDCFFIENGAGQGGSPTVSGVGGNSGGSGGAIHCSSSLKLINCVINQNTAGSGGGPAASGGYAGGVNAGEMEARHTVFENNYAGSGGSSSSQPYSVGGPGGKGGAVSCGKGSFYYCWFTDNHSGSGGMGNGFWGKAGNGGGGGGVYLTEAYFLSCAFVGNKAGNGGDGIPWGGVTPGAGGGGGGVFISQSGSLENCTLVDNSTGYKGSSGGSSYASGGGSSSSLSSTITSCIYWNNNPNSLEDPSPVVSYSNIEGGTGASWFDPLTCLDEDPLFVDELNRDFHLSQDPCQPGIINACVDSGNLYANMINGTTRTDQVQDAGVIDMGYHYPLFDPIRNVPGEYATIQEAIDIAADNETILVAPGTYYENINFQGKRVYLTSEGGPEVTIIDGSGADSVITFDHGEDKYATLEGFTITNGKGSNSKGGAVSCIDASPTICRNRIMDNESDSDGGGIACRDGSCAPVISSNIIHDNRAEAWGGGISCYDSSPVIVNNTLSDNEVTAAGGFGGGIGCWLASPKIINNIVWDNTASNGAEVYGHPDEPSAQFCIIKGGFPGTSNLNADPDFADPTNHDYRITATSPCINRGANDDAHGQDFEGDDSPYMGTVDIGADEFTGLHSLEADVFSIASGSGGTINFTLDGGISNAGRTYFLLASLTGTNPGHTFPNQLNIPVNVDWFTFWLLDLAVKTPYLFPGFGFWATLDATGYSEAQLNFYPCTLSSDLFLAFAYVLYQPSKDFASNPIEITLTK